MHFRGLLSVLVGLAILALALQQLRAELPSTAVERSFVEAHTVAPAVWEERMDAYVRDMEAHYRHGGNPLADHYKKRMAQLNLLARAPVVSQRQRELMGPASPNRLHALLRGHNVANCPSSDRLVPSCRSSQPMQASITHQDLLQSITTSDLPETARAWKRKSASEMEAAVVHDAGDDGYKYEFDPTSFAFRSCAVVGTSGSLLAAEHGTAIDEHEAVFRTNMGMTRGYEKHVGTRTTFRVTGEMMVDYEWCGEVLVRRNHTERFNRASRLFWALFPAEFNIVLNEQHFARQYAKLLRHVTGKEAQGDRSVGMIMILFALPQCQEVSLYGFNSFSAAYKRHYYEEYRGNLYHEPNDEACVIEALRRNGLLTAHEWQYNDHNCPESALSTLPVSLLDP